jgi:hypothetical protein
MEQSPVTKANVNWLFVIAFFLGAAIGVLPISSRIILISTSILYFSENVLIFQIVSLLVNPCILFATIYFWSIRIIGSARIGFLKQSYGRILVLLFLGSIIGYTVFYFSLMFLLGAGSYFPNTVYIVTFILSTIFGIIGTGLGITFVAFSAIALAHLRKSGGF